MAGRTFGEIAADYLSRNALYSENPRSMATQVSVLAPAFGHLRLDEITVKVIEVWMAGRLRAGRSKSTLNQNRSALSVIFEWARREGEWTGPNPARAIKVFKVGPGRTRYLTPDEAARLVMAAAPHLKVLLMLALHTGGRRGELLALTWHDVDIEAGVITFRRETTKSRKTRHVPMSADLIAFLRPLWKPDGPVCTFEGRPLKRARKAFESARRRAGLGKDVVLHTTRHSAASFFVQRGGSIYDLQKILGHCDIKLTERYAHLSPEHIQRCARFLGPPRAGKKETEEA